MSNDEHIKSFRLQDKPGRFELTDRGEEIHISRHYGQPGTLELNSPTIYFSKSFINSDAFDELVAFIKQRARLKKNVEVTWEPIEEER